MKTELFCIYDSVSQVYNKPFHCINVQVALRSVKDMMHQDNEVTRNPMDFSLWHLGSYDDEHAIFELLGTPKRVAPVHEIFRMGDENE